MGCDVSGGISAFDREQQISREEDGVACDDEMLSQVKVSIEGFDSSINPNPTSIGFAIDDIENMNSSSSYSMKSSKVGVGIFPTEENSKVVEQGEGDCVVDVVNCCTFDQIQRERGLLVCRVCQLTSSDGDGGTSTYGDLIQLGCNCRNDLGTAHRCCAEAWFLKRGNTCCEICGAVAKNITGVADGIFILEWNDRRLQNSREVSILHGNQPFCTFVMASVILSFVMLWIFHVH